MHARAGDRIVIRSRNVGGPVRDAEVLEVEHEDGSPPYRVRWSDDGHEGLSFPGTDAYVDHVKQPATSYGRSKGLLRPYDVPATPDREDGL